MSAVVSNGLDPDRGDEEDDMSIDSEVEDEAEKMEQSGTNHAEPLPTIELSFDNSRGGAWDDRELVNAYDAAIEEFHIHHPGPGSWLDKATAALAKGQPLPGATAHGTSWYDASCEVPTANAGPSTNAPPLKRPRKEKRPIQDKHPRSNPYAPQHPQPTEQSISNDRRQSPSYAPGSPTGQSKAPDWSRSNGHTTVHDNTNGGTDGGPYDLANDYDQPVAVTAHPASAAAVPPTTNPSSLFAVQPTDQISADDALSYAMTAQYWAGYWMGVSRAKTSTSTSNVQVPQGQQLPAAESGVHENQEGTRSNIFVTRQRFYRPAPDGLRR